MEIGIQDWGAWVPYYRLTGDVVRGTFGTGGKQSRALASFDEDAVTMAVEAVMGLSTTAEGLYFASASAPYAEKQHAAIIAAAADWPGRTHTVDFGSTLRAGTAAIIAACDAIAAKRLQSAAAVISERRPAPAASTDELNFGDAAVALTMGADPVFAFKGSFSQSTELMDAWRLDGGSGVAEADAKFVEMRSYTVLQPEALKAALDKASWKISDLARAYFWGPDARIWAATYKAAGLTAAQTPADSLFASVGSLGNAHATALLLADLPNLKPGDKVALCGHGSGADVTLWEVTPRIAQANVNVWLEATARHAVWPSYGAHLRARKLIAVETLNPFTAAPVLLREERALFRRHLSLCTACNEAHYPPQPLCRKCRGDRFTTRRLGEVATAVALTADHLYPSPLTPTVMISADVDGGGRFYGQLTDSDGKGIAIGSRVRFTFRRIHEGGGFVNYFWKFRTEVEGA